MAMLCVSDARQRRASPLRFDVGRSEECYLIVPLGFCLLDPDLLCLVTQFVLQLFARSLFRVFS
jgi:hypothetical protein